MDTIYMWRNYITYLETIKWASASFKQAFCTESVLQIPKSLSDSGRWAELKFAKNKYIVEGDLLNVISAIQNQGRHSDWLSEPIISAALCFLRWSILCECRVYAFILFHSLQVM